LGKARVEAAQTVGDMPEIPGKPEPESMVTAQADTAVTTDLPGGKKCSYF
jgi:hypothetical protein